MLWPEIAFHLHAVDSFSFLEDLDVDMFGEDFCFHEDYSIEDERMHQEVSNSRSATGLRGTRGAA